MNVQEAKAFATDASAQETIQDLLQRNKELSEALAAREAFIAVAAHELRNPMTPMLGQVELLLRRLRGGEDDPERIQARLERLRHVMQQYVRRATVLLDVSRMSSGKFRLEPSDCDLADIAREVVDGFSEAVRYAGSSITLEGPQSLPGRWDRLAVEQIIDNLLSNAIKYGARQPVAVSVAAEGDQATLRVRDHGPGISLADRERIFGRFERAVATSERRSGFGIGLWVVGQLVEAMEGAIRVQDAPGGGSIFEVNLPLTIKATPHDR